MVFNAPRFARLRNVIGLHFSNAEALFVERNCSISILQKAKAWTNLFRDLCQAFVVFLLPDSMALLIRAHKDFFVTYGNQLNHREIYLSRSFFSLPS
jgi:hypothetical protein